MTPRSDYARAYGLLVDLCERSGSYDDTTAEALMLAFNAVATIGPPTVVLEPSSGDDLTASLAELEATFAGIANGLEVDLSTLLVLSAARTHLARARRTASESSGWLG